MRAILGALLLAISLTAAAEWVEVGKTDRGTFYIDNGTIRKDGHFRRVAGLQNLSRPGSVGEMSRQALEEYDCKEQQIRVLSISAHSKPNSRGETLLKSDSRSTWRKIPPDNSGYSAAKTLRLVCNSQR